MPAAMKLQESADDLWQLRFHGDLSRLEHRLCSFLLACSRCCEWSDVDLCWVLDVSEERLAACREALAAKNLLRFATGHELGYVTYQVLSAKEQVRRRQPRRKPTGFPPPRQRWIVFEEGKHAHVLRDDDLGSGYGAAHPALVAECVRSQTLDYHTTALTAVLYSLGDTIETAAGEIVAVLSDAAVAAK